MPFVSLHRGAVVRRPDTGASRAFVLSDVGTGAAGRAGELPSILTGLGKRDRDAPGAMPPEGFCLRRKSFSLTFISGSAKLFTVGCGE